MKPATLFLLFSVLQAGAALMPAGAHFDPEDLITSPPTTTEFKLDFGDDLYEDNLDYQIPNKIWIEDKWYPVYSDERNSNVKKDSDDDVLDHRSVPTDPGSYSSADGSYDIGTITGITIAAVIFLIVVCFCCRHKYQKAQQRRHFHLAEEGLERRSYATPRSRNARPNRITEPEPNFRLPVPRRSILYRYRLFIIFRLRNPYRVFENEPGVNTESPSNRPTDLPGYTEASTTSTQQFPARQPPSYSEATENINPGQQSSTQNQEPPPYTA